MTTREFLATANFVGGPFNKLVRHPLARNDGSTLLVLDFGRLDCNVNASGDLAVGDTFQSLGGTINGVVEQTGATPTSLISGGGKIRLPTMVSGNFQRVNIGSAGSITWTGAQNFHAHLVFGLPSDAGSGFVGNQAIFSLGSVSNNQALWFSSGANGRVPSVSVANGTGGVGTLTGFALGNVPNIVSVTRVGGVQQTWLNGILLDTRTQAASLPDISGQTLRIFQGRADATVWAAMVETIPADRSAADVVARARTVSAAQGYE